MQTAEGGTVDIDKTSWCSAARKNKTINKNNQLTTKKGWRRVTAIIGSNNRCYGGEQECHIRHLLVLEYNALR